MVGPDALTTCPPPIWLKLQQLAPPIEQVALSRLYPSEDIETANVLEVVPRLWISHNVLVRKAQNSIAEVNFEIWRERGRIELGESQFFVRREHAKRGRFVLEGPSGVVAMARKPSAWRHRFVIEYEGRQFELRQRRAWSHEFVLSDAVGQIGTVKPRSAWSSRADATLPQDMQMPVQLFAIWLVLAMWHRDISIIALLPLMVVVL